MEHREARGVQAEEGVRDEGAVRVFVMEWQKCPICRGTGTYNEYVQSAPCSCKFCGGVGAVLRPCDWSPMTSRRLTTDLNGDVIFQREFDEMIVRIMQFKLDTFRDALISLGWTPPVKTSVETPVEK